VFALQRPTETPDAELIAAVLDGSEAAFASLVERYQDRVFRLLGRYCRDQVECEDLAQDVFLKVFRKLHTFQGDSQFFTWLYRIAVNAATDHLSKASSRRLRLVEDDASLDTGGDRDEQSPAAPLMTAELAAVTRSIVDSLPEKFRTILVLREFEDDRGHLDGLGARPDDHADAILAAMADGRQLAWGMPIAHAPTHRRGTTMRFARRHEFAHP